MNAIRFLSLLLVSILLAACSYVDVNDYADNQPTLVPEVFFNGKLTAHGVVKNRSGKVIRSFTADITAHWADGIGTLEEDFVFDDNELQRRVWTLTPSGKNRYVGSASDVVGTANMEVAGNSMFLDYVLRIPYGDNTLDIVIDDRMYLVSPEVLINESTLNKFGLNVGQILLVITKHDGNF